MKKIYSLLLGIALLSSQLSNAQCPTPSGMIAVPINLNGSCFINVQFAIPNSNVSIYNASGYVAQGVANASGNVLISYPCASNPITSVVSLRTIPSVQVCNTVTITQLVTLPVKLTAFSANITGSKTVLLKWEAEWEINNDKYELERSTDGINFTKIATISSNGNTGSRQSYSYEDRTFITGTAAFYRLKQTDLDGKFSYSKVIYVNDKNSSSDTYSLFPNPASSNSIQIKGVASSEVTYKNIRVTDMAGRNILFTITGANSIELNATAQPGIYLVRVKDKTLKLVKN